MRIATRVLRTDAPPLSPLMERAAHLRASGCDIINLGQAVVDYAPPPEFLAALAAALPELHGYAPDPGIPILRERLAGYLASNFGLRVAPDRELIITPGANHAAFMALSTILAPDDEALLISPWYFNHAMTIDLLGSRVRSIPARPDEDFRPDIAEILAAATPRTRVLIVINPNNPTGARYPDAWLQDLADAIAQDERWRDVWLLADQTYQEIFFAGPAPRSLGSMDALRERVLTVGSFSKSLALAGWRLGFLAGPAAFVSQALKIQDSSVICAGHAAQYALAETLKEETPLAHYLAQKRALLATRRDALLAPLRARKDLQLHTPEGACFAFVDLPAGTDGERFAWELLERFGVVIIPGTHFGPRWEGHVRLSFGRGDPTQLTEAAERISSFLDEPRR